MGYGNRHHTSHLGCRSAEFRAQNSEPEEMGADRGSDGCTSPQTLAQWVSVGTQAPGPGGPGGTGSEKDEGSVASHLPGIPPSELCGPIPGAIHCLTVDCSALQGCHGESATSRQPVAGRAVPQPPGPAAVDTVVNPVIMHNRPIIIITITIPSPSNLL